MTPRPAPTAAELAEVLARFPRLEQPTATRIDGGLIHHTFRVVDPSGRFILQRQHAVFGSDVNWDILAVTRHLRDRGVTAPELVLARDGSPFVSMPHGTWRLMTEIAGVTIDVVESPRQARSAAAVLASFHGALADFTHEFRHRRAGVHDTAAHLDKLRVAVEQRADHRLHTAVAPLAADLLARAAKLDVVVGVPERVVHGDPKLNNVIFSTADRDEAVCMIDLDTVGRMPLHFELGDCWRSWCNPAGEDADDVSFDLDIFAAAVEGYRSRSSLETTPAEQRALVYGVEWITLELSARFAADALLEQYFGWDAQRWPAAGEHNLARARGQWRLHESVMACRAARAEILAGRSPKLR